MGNCCWLTHCAPILKRCERDSPILHADQVIAWPESDLDYWIAAGVLGPLSPARSLPCLGCGGEYVWGNRVLDRCEHGRNSRTCLVPIVAPRRFHWPHYVAGASTWNVSLWPYLPTSSSSRKSPSWRRGDYGGSAKRMTLPATSACLSAASCTGKISSESSPVRDCRPEPWSCASAHMPAHTADVLGPLILPLTELASFASGRVLFDREQVADRLAEWPQDSGHAGEHGHANGPRARPTSPCSPKRMQEHLCARGTMPSPAAIEAANPPFSASDPGRTGPPDRGKPVDRQSLSERPRGPGTELPVGSGGRPGPDS